MNVVIIGTGNVGSMIGRLCIKAGHNISQIYSRTALHAQKAANEFGAVAVNTIDDISKDADLYIICIPDKVLTEEKLELSVPGKLVVHTAGSVSYNVLLHYSNRVGVLYPLQSISSSDTSLPEIPFLVDANAPEDRQILLSFAKDLSGNASIISNQERGKIHLAAVFVNNFTNHLFEIAQQLCEENSVDFNLLLPLIKNTVQKLEHSKAAENQTGPALRRDDPTIQKHMQMLNHHPEYQKLYSMLSESIQSLHPL